MQIIIRPIENVSYRKGIEVVDTNTSSLSKEFRQIHRFRCKFCKKYIKKYLIWDTVITKCPHCEANIFE